MKKLILFLVLLIAIIVVYFVWTKKYNADLDASGTIIMREPFETKEYEGPSGWYFVDVDKKSFSSLNLSDGSILKHMDGTFKFIISNGNEVGIYDKETDTIEYVYQMENSYGSIVDIEYINSDYLSVQEQDKIVLVNMKSGEKKAIVEDYYFGNTHSWTEDGKILCYVEWISHEPKIHSLNIDTMKKEFLYDGRDPKISPDGRYIAYKDIRNKLVVKDLENGDSCRYPGAPVDYCFSPDGEFLAVFEYYRGLDLNYFMGHSLKVWDYKNNRTETILPKVLGNRGSIDWVE